MKAEVIKKILALSFCSLIFASAIFAQEKPRAIEFAQIGVSKTGEIEDTVLTETLEKFISRLEKEPETTRGYIDIPENTKAGEKIKSFLAKYSTLENRILFWGNLRHPDFPMPSWGIYLYIVPQGAEIPSSSIDETCVCPTIIINAPTELTIQLSALTFTAKVEGGYDIDKITYLWKVSSGKIIEGQGTPIIRVEAELMKEITATVEISGDVCDECQREASFTIPIKFPYKFAEFSGQGEDFKIYPDILLTELNNNPQLQAKMFVYAPRSGSKKTLYAGIEKAKWTMRIIKFPLEKLPIEIGGVRENLTFEIWVYPKDGESPKPTPTVDEKLIVPAKKVIYENAAN